MVGIAERAQRRREATALLFCVTKGQKWVKKGWKRAKQGQGVYLVDCT
jgi:hypothetical protein